MDFQLSLTISGIVSFVFLVGAATIFSMRLSRVFDDLTHETKRALSFFGASLLSMGMIGLQALFVPQLVTIWVALMLCLLVISQSYLFARSKRNLNISIIVSLLIFFMILVETFLRLYISFTPTALIIGLSVLMLAAGGMGIVLVVRTPSPFTGSMLILLVVFVVTWISASSGTVASNPEFFMLEVAPIAIAASILAATLKPWRYIIIYFLAIFGAIASISLVIPALIAGDFFIWTYTLIAPLAGISVIIPLDFFLEQVQELKTRTPQFISITLIGVGLLAITHANAWAIAVEMGEWDPGLLYVDWIIGVVAVMAFTLAGLSSVLSQKITGYILDIELLIASSFVVLGHPYIQAQRYGLQPLYIPLAGIILVGVLAHAYSARAIARAGSSSAARRFILFIMASLGIGIVAMFSDVIPYGAVLVLIVLAALMLLLSGPRRISIASRGMNHTNESVAEVS
ncbi:hypothetical protein EU537_05270 [Candidatus Thorarchaeota archaeon]|nr:MAG: hypothetical protein EU537_05270 [Candidatus Thorarchaeota archaeon]